MSRVHAIRLFLSLLGTPNWYQGIDKPSFWQWFYKWRISPKTAWEIAKKYISNP